MYSQLTVAKLFDLSQTQAETLLNRFQYPWEALPHIKEFILALGPSRLRMNTRRSRKMFGRPSPPLFFLPRISTGRLSSVKTLRSGTAHSYEAAP